MAARFTRLGPRGRHSPRLPLLRLPAPRLRPTPWAVWLLTRRAWAQGGDPGGHRQQPGGAGCGRDGLREDHAGAAVPAGAGVGCARCSLSLQSCMTSQLWYLVLSISPHRPSGWETALLLTCCFSENQLLSKRTARAHACQTRFAASGIRAEGHLLTVYPVCSRGEGLPHHVHPAAAHQRNLDCGARGRRARGALRRQRRLYHPLGVQARFRAVPTFCPKSPTQLSLPGVQAHQRLVYVSKWVGLECVAFDSPLLFYMYATQAM